MLRVYIGVDSATAAKKKRDRQTDRLKPHLRAKKKAKKKHHILPEG